MNPFRTEYVQVPGNTEGGNCNVDMVRQKG